MGQEAPCLFQVHESAVGGDNRPLMAVRGHLGSRLDGRYAAVAHLTRAMVLKSLIESALVCPVEDLGGRPVGYTTAPWVGFGEALAAVAGALTGLLFVALSVKGDVVAASRSLSSRAAETLVLFMISVLVLVAVLLVAPQPAAALGSELLAVAVVSGAALLILDRRAGHGSDQVVAPLHRKVLPQHDHRRARWRCWDHLPGEGRWWLVLADPRHRGESGRRCGQRVAVPRQGDRIVPLIPCLEGRFAQRVGQPLRT